MSFNVRSVVNQDSQIWRTLWKWPKIELHRHLEGAVRLPTLIDVAHEYDIPLPVYTIEQLRPYVQVTDEDEASINTFLSKFDSLRQFYRSMDVVGRIAREAVEDAAADNVKYMEMRFTPHALIQQNNYDYQDVIQTVCESVAAAEAENDITVRLIVSVNRHEPVEIAEHVLNATLRLESDYVVGMDLAGREVGYSAKPFQAVFRRAKEAGLSITIHAGEWQGPENVAEAILDVGADRIGHGVRTVEDNEVLQLVRDREITLEVCPTSNLHTGVVQHLDMHPLIDLSYLDVMTTINTDDPSISAISLTDELVLAHVGLDLPLSTIKKNILNAAHAAFLPRDERDHLVARFSTGMGADDTLMRPPGIFR